MSIDQIVFKFEEDDNVKIDSSDLLNETDIKIMRRRSCCCKWCGGISEFEMKNQDIISDLQKYGRPDDIGECSPGGTNIGQNKKDGKKWGKVKTFVNCNYCYINLNLIF